MPLPKVISTIDQQIAEHQANGNGTGTTVGVPGALYYLVRTGDTLPPWWSPARDRALHDLYLGNNHLSGLVYLATTKLANIPMTFVPRDPTVTSHVEASREFTMLMNLGSEFGKGFRRAVKKMIVDYLVLDNGGFMEILGNGPADGPIRGSALGVRHLDSLACTRTGNLEYPVVFQEGGKRYKLHYTRVIDMVQNASGRAGMNDVGLSSISRSMELGQVLKDQLTYKLEKMGSRPANQIIAGKNMEAVDIVKAFMMAQELMDSLGLTRYAKVVAIGGNDIEVSKIDLNNFEPFDEEKGTLMAVFAMAYIWGLDVRDIWAAGGGGKGEQIANMKARGRLPADFVGDLSEQLELKVCPPFLKPLFDFQDDEEDQMRSVNQDIRSRRYQRMAKDGVLDNEAMQRMMVQDGDLTREEFVRLQLADGKLEDGSPIGTLFFSDDDIIRALCTLDGIESPLLYEENDAGAVFKAIDRQKSLAMELLAKTKSIAQRRKAIEALAALDWLAGEYRKHAVPVPQENMPDQEQMNERETGADMGDPDEGNEEGEDADANTDADDPAEAANNLGDADNADEFDDEK